MYKLVLVSNMKEIKSVFHSFVFSFVSKTNRVLCDEYKQPNFRDTFYGI